MSWSAASISRAAGMYLDVRPSSRPKSEMPGTMPAALASWIMVSRPGALAARLPLEDREAILLHERALQTDAADRRAEQREIGALHRDRRDRRVGPRPSPARRKDRRKVLEMPSYLPAPSRCRRNPWRDF
ncbi:hypothetical protein [Sorangium cellulosum]|uniref:hypothetical protein n=1 Tax=Sorangium cellulosum TaxID=56 RepID=UPI003D9C5F10